VSRLKTVGQDPVVKGWVSCPSGGPGEISPINTVRSKLESVRRLCPWIEVILSFSCRSVGRVAVFPQGGRDKMYSLCFSPTPLSYHHYIRSRTEHLSAPRAHLNPPLFTTSAQTLLSTGSLSIWANEPAKFPRGLHQAYRRSCPVNDSNCWCRILVPVSGNSIWSPFFVASVPLWAMCLNSIQPINNQRSRRECNRRFVGVHKIFSASL
jgi:hypothetical protein